MRRLSGEDMNKAYRKDIRRSIKKGWKRFLSILIITALGVAMLTGLYASCLDMYYSADKFFDQQNLFDIRILSTLGLTEEDVEALVQVNGVETAEGAYSETVHTDVAGVGRSAEMTVLSSKGLNIPYLLAGTLPTKEGEIAVTQKYMGESGKSIGDTLTVEEDVGDNRGKSAGEAKNDMGAEDIQDGDNSLGKDINLNVEMGLEEEMGAPAFANTTYTITGVVTDPMDIQSNGIGSLFRSTVTSDYTFFITAADADSDIFTVVYITLAGTQGMNCYSDEYENAVQTVIGNIEKHIKKQREQVRYDSVQLEARMKVKDAEKTMNEKFAEADAKFASAWKDIAGARQKLADGEAALADGEKDAAKEMAEVRAELKVAKQKLAESEAELIEQAREYAGKKEEAIQKLADAYAELDNIDRAQWYVQDRTSLDSYSSLNSDLSSIEAVGKVFPVIFLLVAVLMSLTTMTRMVEEERGLIGTYKALGFGNTAVYRKYILFALMACLLGGILGDMFGFIFMPKFVSVVLEELYRLPQYYLRFDILYGVGGVMLFMAAIVGATAFACRNELTQMPAALMRPKAPRAGARVFLESIPAIWNRLKFLNKVTVRNLFRYKKRLFMIVGGIMGCTALILCGFAIKDSISDLAPKQYENIYQYDLMAVAEEDDNDGFIQQLSADGNIEEYLNLRIDSVKLINTGGKAEKAQLMVIPDGGAIEDYIRTENLEGTLIYLDDGGIFVTQNAARILGLRQGETVSVQDMEFVEREVVVSGVVQNYLGNNVYMTQKLYESLFGTYAPNGVLAHLSDACTDQAGYAEMLLGNDSVLSAVSTDALKEEFGFDLINAVMLLINVMAGGLAFVVLFTLSNTNISERVRELATIKVLGFYDNEVHQYVNKETLILTIAGILIGLPVGRIISGFLTVALKMPSIHFAVHVEPVSYLISAAITFCFAIVVNWITNRTLDCIDMVEALKSVE